MHLVEDKIRHTIQKVTIERFVDADKQFITGSDYVISEKIINLQVDAIGEYTLTCTPNNLKQLVVGFLYTQGIIGSFEDIEKITQTKEQVKVTLKHNVAIDCKESYLPTLAANASPLMLSASIVFDLVKTLQTKQRLFKITGAAHAAGIFDKAGNFLACHEDIGRHNAIDKCIGDCLIHKRCLVGCGLLLSSRVAWELVKKAARAGIELVAAISAPSSLAIKSAKEWNITLCGFIRDDKLNVYTHNWRVIPSAEINQ